VSGISDLNHFAYPTFAKAARLRLDNIANSKRDLSEQRIASELFLAQAEAELAKAENLESREGKPPPLSIRRQST
jgi:F0F1-type ATP synthase membrane subunit b/b'